MLLVQFGESSCELLRIFVFNKLAFCDVIIPGRESEIHLRMPFDVTKLQTKSEADNVSGTMLFYQMSNIDNGVCPTYKMVIETPKLSMEVPCKFYNRFIYVFSPHSTLQGL